jgi:ribosome-associated translation inhibitor RaiA
MNDFSRPANLRVRLDTHHCQLSPAEIGKMEAGLASLGKQVEAFPVSDLHILVERNARSNDVSVKTSLMLTGETLVSSDHDVQAYTAFERCVNNLVQSVRAYKDRMSNVPERQKQDQGTQKDLAPSLDPDRAALEAAVADGDYPAFRAALLGYEDPLRQRVGRWVQRYPDLAARIDHGVKLDDVVEAVFLAAFDAYEQRPRDGRLGDWLERLIDPALKDLQRHPDELLENVNLARSAAEAQRGRRPA